MKRFLTACPRNCYSTCSFYVDVEDNRLVAIHPDRESLSVPEGPCIKGLSYIERAMSPDRITRPMLKNSMGEFQEISYDQAFEIIVSKLTSLSDSGDQKSVLYYTGSGMSGLTNSIGHNFFRAYGGATTTYGNFCWPAGLEAVRLTLGEVKHNSPWDIENAGLIILWGKNTAETNIQEINFISKAAEKGAKIIVIDPRKTPTADKGDKWISPRPGTDAALALAICRLLIDNGDIDRDFIFKYVMGFDQFNHSLDITPAMASEITGVPVQDITDLALLLGSRLPTTIIAGYGIQRYTNGGQTIRAIMSINIITGNIGKPGCSFNYANLQGYIFDHHKEPLSYYPDIDPDPLFRRSVSVALLGKSLGETRDPAISMAWIERGNPLTQAPDTNLVEIEFRKLDFVVVIDQFMNDTAQLADLLLPAKNMFEQQDIISSYWSPYIYYRPRILYPPEGLLTEPEIYYYLARRMNLEFTADQIPMPGYEGVEKWLNNRIEGFSELTIEKIKERPVIAPGSEEVAFSNHHFKTRSGRIELFSDEASDRWAVENLPSFSDPFLKEHPEGEFYYITPNNRNRIHSQFGNLNLIRVNDPEPMIQVSVEDAARLGIEDKDTVRVFNMMGEIFLKADVTERIRKGCVSFPNGWWKTEGGGGNRLSSGSETDMGFGTAFHNTKVSIEKYRG